MKQELIPLSSKVRWEAALQGIKHDFAHTWNSCHAMQLTTGYKTYLYVFQDGPIKIVCPLAERSYNGYTDVLTPYGFSGFIGNYDLSEFQSCWQKFLKSCGYICGYISINPLFENSVYLGSENVYKNNSLYYLDLRLSIEKLFNNLDRNRKRQLKDWDIMFPDFVLDRSLLEDFLLRNYHNFFRNKQASKGYMFSLDTLSYIMSLENVLAVGIGDKKIGAISIFAYTEYAAQAMFHISLPEARHYTMPLLWYAINYLKTMEIPFLNMGGGLEEGDSIAEFKQRCGAIKVPLKSLRQVYNHNIFNKLCHISNSDPTNMAGYFPPYYRFQSLHL